MAPKGDVGAVLTVGGLIHLLTQHPRSQPTAVVDGRLMVRDRVILEGYAAEPDPDVVRALEVAIGVTEQYETRVASEAQRPCSCIPVPCVPCLAGGFVPCLCSENPEGGA